MSFVGIFWIKTCCFSDDDFVPPKKNKEAQEQPAHPILGHGNFPNFEATLPQSQNMAQSVPAVDFYAKFNIEHDAHLHLASK